MKVLSAFLLVCVSGYAAARMEVENRVPAKLGHLAQIKQKDPQAMVPVRTTNGDVVAQISKIVLDADGQRPKFAVLSLFDNVAPNQPQIVVPWETLTVNTNTSDVFVNASVEKLREADGVRVNDVPGRAPSDWGAQYYGFYGVQPRQSEPEPNATGTAGRFSGVVKGSGSSRETATPVVDVTRGNLVYICLGLFLVIFAVVMVGRRRERNHR